MTSIISLAGDIGAGKGTVGKLLIESTGYEFISTGNILREIAEKLNMSIVELNKYAETHKEIDKEADNRLKEIEKHRSSLIVDSRLGWHFIPSSFKVFLSASPETAAKRISKDDERKGEETKDEIELVDKIKERKELENRRFQALYGIDSSNYRNYDLVIQTDKVSPKNIVDIILYYYSEKQSLLARPLVFISPTNAYPLEPARFLGNEQSRSILKSVKQDGFDFSQPIEVIQNKGFFYIWNGHKRCSAAIANDVPLIPATIVAKDDEVLISGKLKASTAVEDSYNLSWIYDWEDAHKFRFDKYPK